jgi:predicted SPOUT superfamily RNA methylase MTH1
VTNAVELRQEERHPFRSPIEISWTDGDGGQHHAVGTSINVSGYGMMVEISEAIPLGANVRVRIEERDISSKARVRHCNPQAQYWFRVGLHFDRSLIAEQIPSLDAVLIQSLRDARFNTTVAPAQLSKPRQFLCNVARMMHLDLMRA